MSNPEQLDRELREYLEKEPNLKKEDRLNFLRGIVNKHLEFNNMDHMLNSNDIYDIVSNAKMIYTKFSLPLRISRKQVDPCDAPHVAMIESIVGYLNKTSLLKKLVKIDYTG